jgi:hypothetical protein
VSTGQPLPISFLASKLCFIFVICNSANYGLSEAHGEVASNNLMGHSLVHVPFSPSTKDILPSLSYKPQHTPVAQRYHSLCHHLDTALAIHLLLIIVDLLIKSDCFHLGFAPTNSPHNLVPYMPEMTALDWLCYKISNHLFCRAPFNGQLLHIHLICDEKVANVDMPCTFPTGGFAVPLK